MEYTKEYVNSLVKNQKDYFNSGATLPISFRIKQLKRLKKMLLDNENLLIEALHLDLGRSETEAYLFDIASSLLEINENIKNIKKWAKKEVHYSGLLAFPSTKTYVYKLPYGVSAIISPFNFPVFLSIGVLVASIGAGNTAILKTSSKSKHTTDVLIKIISETFPSNYISILGGGHDVSDYLLQEKVDKIFYTGSPRIGKHVLDLAKDNLVPVTLELGGEEGNWCIIRKDADIKDAARKIAFCKIANSGQICININSLLVAKEISNEFIKELKKAIIKQIGENPLNNKDYPKMIGETSFNTAINDINKYQERIIFGGGYDLSSLKIEPTLIYPVDINEDIVRKELFSPLLPIVETKDQEIEKMIKLIDTREHPLAMYIFTKDIKWAKKIMSTSQFGGGAINEVLIHSLIKGVPFNGVGHSGMGAYHGEWGFKEFSHPQTVLLGKSRGNLSLREHPYNKKKLKLIKRIVK